MMEKIRIVLASRNQGKVAELQRLLDAALGEVAEVLSLDAAGITGEIEENGKNFAENALIKARVAAQSGYIGLGDDSGLMVYALNMEPGIYSARYGGDHDDAANNRYLLQRMKGKSDRRALFATTLACVFPDGSEPLLCEGRVEGEILSSPRGENGFGYDPLFYYPPMQKTMAEMTAEEKNGISHRGAAVQAFARLFADRIAKKPKS